MTCSRCNKATTVPFTPTPGRPVYCRECYANRPAPPRGGLRTGRGPGGFAKPNVMPRKRMLAQGRKGHFVYDMRELMERHENVDEAQQRMFIEMVFTRGSRHSTDAAKEFIHEKVEDKTISPDEARRMEQLVDRYSQYR